MKITIRNFIKKIVKNTQLFIMVMKLLLIPKKKSGKQIAFVFNVSKWKKSYLLPYLKDFDVRFIPLGESLWLLNLILSNKQNAVFIVWGYNHDSKITSLAAKYQVPIYRMEDGFIRSVGLGSMHTPPYSMCMDKRGIYFDATKPSDLEVILNSYNFSEDPNLIRRAELCMEQVIKLGVSKYNHVEVKDIESIYGPKHKQRILVIGQVEDDASIAKGSLQKWTNNDLVRLASKENPNAEIIYKPHPDVLTGRRPMQSDPNEIKDIAKVIHEGLSIPDALNSIDHVYTITSLAGFEAILRDIPVTTVGAPFYSGWGLTDDRQTVSRRKRILTKEELFAGAYILYPKYINPYTQENIAIEVAIESIAKNS